MNGQHLSDERIQEYLDGAPGDKEIRRHLDECADCRRVLADYHRLVAGLDALPDWDPGPGFAESLLPFLPPRRRHRTLLFGVCAALVLSGAALMFWGLSPKAPGQAAANFFRSFAPLVQPLKAFAGRLLGRLGGSFDLIAASLLALAVIGLADSFVGRRLLHSPGLRR